MSPAATSVLCVGAAHWDLIGRSAGPLGAGADVPGRVERQPGGVAQNVARALAALGRPARLIAAVGRDRPGDDLADSLASAGVDTTWLWRHDGPSDAYLAIEGPGGALHAAVADCRSLETAGPALLAPLRPGPRWAGRVVADGNLPAATLVEVLALPGPVAFVPASPAKLAALAPILLAARPVLYLNRAEAEVLGDRAFADSARAAAALHARTGAEVLVTDGPGPASAAADGATATLPVPSVAATSVTGAGDALVAAHLAARDDGLDTRAALAAALDAAVRHVAAERFIPTHGTC